METIYYNYYTQKVELSFLIPWDWKDHREYADLVIGVLAPTKERAAELIEQFNIKRFFGYVESVDWGELEFQDSGYDDPEGVEFFEGDYDANTGDRDDNYGIQWERNSDNNKQYYN